MNRFLRLHYENASTVKFTWRDMRNGRMIQKTDVEVPAANLIITFNNRPVRLSPAIRSVTYGTLLSGGKPAGYLPKAHTLCYK